MLRWCLAVQLFALDQDRNATCGTCHVGNDLALVDRAAWLAVVE